MYTRVVLSFALCVAAPAWSQVSTTDGGVGLAMTDEMQTPPPVSDRAYPSATGAETHSNYLRAAFNLTTGFSDNVRANVIGTLVYAVNDVFYTLYSNLGIDRSTPRAHLILNYSPGFTFYQRTSSYNQQTHDLDLNLQYRLSPHVTFTLLDALLKSSGVLNQPYLVSGEAVSGSAPPLISVVSPIADVFSNVGAAQLSYQFRRDGMVGGGWSFGNQQYLNKTEDQGLSDSSSRGGSAFYNHRLSKRHYIGASYQYSRILVYPTGTLSEITANSIAAFYTMYLSPTVSLSVSGGPQHFSVFQSPLPIYSSWQPTLTAGVGWQMHKANIVGSYSRIVSGGGGLVGAFESTSATVSARRQLSRTWSAGVALSYMVNENITPAYLQSTAQGGHSATGAITAQHPLSEHFELGLGYTRWQQKYSSLQAISNTPSTDRVFFTVTYKLRRRLGD
jgi:hypothetical protein